MAQTVRNHFNFLVISYVTSYAVRVAVEYLKSQTKIKDIFCCYLAPVFAQLIRPSDWDQNLGVRLVFGLSF